MAACPNGPLSMDIIKSAGVNLEYKNTMLLYAVTALMLIRTNFRKKVVECDVYQDRASVSKTIKSKVLTAPFSCHTLRWLNLQYRLY